MTTNKPTGAYTVFDYNPRTRRFEERSGPRGSTYTDRARDRDFGKRSGPHNPSALPSSGGYGGGSASRAVRAAARIGLLGARAHPVVRTTTTAFDVAHTLLGEWGITSPAEYGEPDFSGFERFGSGWGQSGWVSCFDPNVPWTGPGGTGYSLHLNTPGGGCGPGFFHVNAYHSDTAPTDLADYMLDWRIASGVRQWSYRAFEGGGANGRELWHRHEMKLKTTAAGWRNNTGFWEIPYPEGIRIPLKVTRQPVVQRLPAAAPPPPVIQESSTPRPNVAPRNRPYQAPSIQVSPGGSVSFPPHNRAPTVSGTRERKANAGLRTALGVIAKIYDSTTEAKDIIDILYDNLGKKCKGAKSLSDKSYCVYKNIGSLNVGNAVLELAKNHYEDKVYGKFFGTVGKHTGFGSMLPGTGPSRDPGPVRNLSARS